MSSSFINELTTEEQELLKTSSTNTFLVRNASIPLGTKLKTYDTYRYSKRSKYKYIAQKKLLNEINACFHSYVNVIFYNCNISINYNFSTSFENCNFINCVFSGDWSKVKIDEHTKFKKCKTEGYFALRTAESLSLDNLSVVYRTNHIYLSNPLYFLKNVNTRNALNLMPDTGSFAGYKAAYYIKPGHTTYTPVIVELKIPEDARKSNGLSYKCRADKALVVDIYDLKGKHYNTAYSIRDYTNNVNLSSMFTYTKGDIVYSDAWNTDPLNECSHGIHFFMNKALAYYWIACN